MPTMIVLVNLKEGVSPEEYERWIIESYAPAAKSLFGKAHAALANRLSIKRIMATLMNVSLL